MTTRDGKTWLVLRAAHGGPYVAARSDSVFVRVHKGLGTLAGKFTTLQMAQERARELNR
jgi:hypothetical protein